MITTPPDCSTWQHVAGDLHARIAANEFTAGDRPPPRCELMQRYEAADRTVTRALHQLRDDGHLITRSTVEWELRYELPAK